MKVIAFTNQKGGVGKTTSTSNVGAALAGRGFRVLLLDLDPQANLTDDLGIKDPEQTINKALFFDADPTPYRITENLDLIAGSNATAAFEAHAKAKYEGLESIVLKDFFSSFKGKYDFLLIDSPPGLGMVVANIYAFADRLYIPLDIDKNAILGLNMVLTTAERLKKINPALTVGGIFFTKYEKQTHVSRYLTKYVSDKYGPLLMETKIRFNGVAIKESVINRKSVLIHAPESNGAQDYQALTNEILCNHNILS